MVEAHIFEYIPDDACQTPEQGLCGPNKGVDYLIK